MSPGCYTISVVNLMIVGVSKNAHKWVELAHNKISGISYLSGASWTVVDSNSSEFSKKYLSELAQKNENLEVIFLDDDLPSTPRTSRIARARDVYVDSINRKRPEKVIVLDFDPLLIRFLRIPQEIVNRKGPIVYTARQLLCYYDIFALREIDSQAQGVVKHEEHGRPNMSWLLRTVPKQISLSLRARKQIQVLSAFGGLAIYPGDLFRVASYEFRSESPYQCEHANLHERAKLHGYQCVVEPTLIYGVTNVHCFLIAPLWKLVSLLMGGFSSTSKRCTKQWKRRR